MDEIEQEEFLGGSEKLLNLFVFWKQAYPSPLEIAALKEIDPDLRDKTIAEVAEMTGDEDFWRLGPFYEIAEVDAIEAQLRLQGFIVQRGLL